MYKNVCETVSHDVIGGVFMFTNDIYIFISAIKFANNVRNQKLADRNGGRIGGVGGSKCWLQCPVQCGLINN